MARASTSRRPGPLERAFSLRSPQALLVLSFAGLIIVGTLLLLLPVSHAPGRVGPVEALFTSTSAVCVTGLVVVDTAKDFTTFGQVVILLLIQLGGLGVMTFAGLIFRVLGRRMSLSGQAAIQDSLTQRDMATEFRGMFVRILRTVAAIEAVGALLLFFMLLPSEVPGHAAYSAVFHAVSAFCNAGFSIYSENLIHLQDNAPALIVIMGLIVLGGVGHVVIAEIWGLRRGNAEDSGAVMPGAARPRRKRLSLHTRVVLLTTACLILVGTLGLTLFGVGGQQASLGHRLWVGLFQSVTARTAGFNTIPMGALPVASLVLLSGLMFVGGSPASCAGGVKTTSLAVYYAQLKAMFLRRNEAVILGRSLARDVVDRAGQLFMLAAGWNLLGIVILAALEAPSADLGLERIVFEQCSAFGTVGLSTDLTPALSTASRLWIIATMFVGRLGPLTLATWVGSRHASRVRHPEGRVMIG